jgi:hypothetical protein
VGDQASRAYLLEEIAVHSIMYQDLQAYTFYPGKQQESYKLLRSPQSPSIYKGLQNSSYVQVKIFAENEVLPKAA